MLLQIQIYVEPLAKDHFQEIANMTNGKCEDLQVNNADAGSDAFFYS